MKFSGRSFWKVQITTSILFFGPNGKNTLGFSAWYHPLINRGFGWGSVDNLSLSKPKDPKHPAIFKYMLLFKETNGKDDHSMLQAPMAQKMFLQFFRLKMRPLRIGTRTSVTSEISPCFPGFGTSHVFPCPKPHGNGGMWRDPIFP